MPYAKAGAHIVFPAVTVTYETLDPSRAAAMNTYGYEGGPAIGALYGFGARVKIADDLFVTGEWWMANVSWGPDRLEQEDGTVVVEYRESYRVEDTINQPYPIATQPRLPFDAMGVTLRLMYAF